MKNYDDLVTNSVKFNLMLKSLKSQFCISNVLAHLLFCNRSPDNSDKCKHCSRHYVHDATDFISSIKYHLTSIFPSKFEKDLELLFANTEVERLDLDLLYHSETYYTLFDSKQNRCIYFLVAKKLCGLAVNLSEVWLRILINDFVCIYNDLLIDGEYGMSSRKEKRAEFLDSCL